jgi:hypothetical protein
MWKRPDLWIATVVLAVCAYAVARQLGVDPLGADTGRRVALGERIDVDAQLLGLDGEGTLYRLGDYMGERFTVFYTWSLKCPCVEEVEPRLKALYAKYNERTAGMAWVGIDAEPDDDAGMIVRVMGKLHSFYAMLRDPTQQVVRNLGLDRAVQIALVDHEGRLLYRGPIDDGYDLRDVTRSYLAEALETALRGGAMPVPPAEPAYGCLFGDPASCEEAAEATEAIKARRRAEKEAARARAHPADAVVDADAG